MDPTAAAQNGTRSPDDPMLSGGASDHLPATVENILDRSYAHRLTVRMMSERDEIETVEIVVIPRSDGIDEIDKDRHVLGYIQRAGRVFVALAGDRLDQAEECGQSLLWDRAASAIVHSHK